MFRYKRSIYILGNLSPVSFKEQTISYLDSVYHIHPIYLRKSNGFTASPCPPTRKHFLACHSTGWSTLIGNPINCGEAICRIVVSTSSSNTGCKLSAVNAFDPWYGGLVYNSRVWVVDVVHGQLDVDFLIRIKYERLKLNDLTLILCPGWKVMEGVSSFLKRKTYK